MRAPRDPNQAPLPPRAGSSNQTSVTTPTGETAEVLSSGPRPRIDAEDIGLRDGRVRGSVIDEDAPPPVVERWVVLRDAQFTQRGMRVKLNAGKTVDSLNYDVKHLIRQGVKLQKLEEGEDAADVLVATG